ncbi:MAG: class I SAM-dependent DNA methyltransferase [Patulibacter sp.]
MITGELRSKIDRIWDAFWSGGISNPLEVIEQITYLLFLKRIDVEFTRAERKANATGAPVDAVGYPEGVDGHGRDLQDVRWSHFSELDPEAMFDVVASRVFPWLQGLGGEGSTYAEHMKGARFTIPKASLLDQVVTMIDDLPTHERDTSGDLYEYMLSKIATSGTNGQFRTPRHIIELMVAMTSPGPDDEICDPACGTAGFLVAAAEHLRREYPDLLHDAKQKQHFHESMFHGYDFDSTMLRIGSMNMLLHGVEQPDIRYRDSLAEGASDEEGLYDLILANPPFTGSLDYESVSKDLQRVVKTKKTELLFVALILRLLKIGGQAAVIVPDGVMFGSSKAHKTLRQAIVDDHKLDAVVKLPAGVFKPYAGVSTAILFFTRTDRAGTTDEVWFYDLTADGFSLDDKRTPQLAGELLGTFPAEPLTDEQHAKSNLPDALARWTAFRDGGERDRARTDQSFVVPVSEICEQDYDLSIGRYKEIVYDEVEHRPPGEILDDLDRLETEITEGLGELRELLR